MRGPSWAKVKAAKAIGRAVPASRQLLADEVTE